MCEKKIALPCCGMLTWHPPFSTRVHQTPSSLFTTLFSAPHLSETYFIKAWERPCLQSISNFFLGVSLSFELFYALHFLQLSFVYRSKFRVLPRNFVITKNLRLRKSWKSKKFQALRAQFLYTNFFSVSFPSFLKPWQTVVAFFENP